MRRPQPDPRRQAQALTALRWLLAGLIAAHGWHRLLTGGYAPFGEFLTGAGIPLGPWLAVGITAFEVAGTPLLALGRWLAPLCLAYAAIYAAGIWLVHAPAGWFVVGTGRNGVEFSVLLIAALLAVAWGQTPRRP